MRPVLFPAARANSLDRRVDLAERLLQTPGKGLTARGERDAAGGADEQRFAEEFLDRTHRMADGRRAEPQFGRGADKTAMTSDGENDREVGKQASIHC